MISRDEFKKIRAPYSHKNYARADRLSKQGNQLAYLNALFHALMFDALTSYAYLEAEKEKESKEVI